MGSRSIHRDELHPGRAPGGSLQSQGEGRVSPGDVVAKFQRSQGEGHSQTELGSRAPDKKGDRKKHELQIKTPSPRSDLPA